MSLFLGPSKKVRYDDPDLEEILRQWTNEVERDTDHCESGTVDFDKNLRITSRHNSNSETEIWRDDNVWNISEQKKKKSQNNA